MAYYLKKYEGLSCGPSSALNVCGAVKLARKLGPGHTIVTILCDTGDRYLTKLWKEDWFTDNKSKTDLTPSKYT